MPNTPVVHVHIFGTEYKIASTSDPDHTRQVARYVDRTMREIASSLSLRSVAKIAVLTAVNLADELLKEEAATQQIQQAAVKNANRLAESTGQR
ncbi:MAG: cell division protein ZapA [bacterium]|nr:cell division protein ZapA [bacterium]